MTPCSQNVAGPEAVGGTHHLTRAFPMTRLLFRRSLASLLAAGALAACARDGSTGVTAPSSAALDRGSLGSIQVGADRLGRGGLDNGLGRPGVRDIESMTTGNWQQVFKAATCAPHAASVESGVFGPGGGTLYFAGSRLIIPGGALRDTVTISATIPEGASSSVEFAPHGLQFLKPAGLVLNTASCELANPLAPAVVYLAPDGSVLQYIEAVFDPHWRTIAAPIDHFSGYAIAF